MELNNEQSIGKYLKEVGSGLIKILARHLSGEPVRGISRKVSFRIAVWGPSFKQNATEKQIQSFTSRSTCCVLSFRSKNEFSV
jgi:hypothetical protein